MPFMCAETVEAFTPVERSEAAADTPRGQPGWVLWGDTLVAMHRTEESWSQSLRCRTPIAVALSGSLVPSYSIHLLSAWSTKDDTRWISLVAFEQLNHHHWYINVGIPTANMLISREATTIRGAILGCQVYSLPKYVTPVGHHGTPWLRVDQPETMVATRLLHWFS